MFVLETNDCLSAVDLAALLMLNFEYASFFSWKQIDEIYMGGII